MPSLIISNTCGYHLVYNSIIGDMPKGRTKTVDVTVQELDDLAELLTAESAAGRISYNVQEYSGIDDDVQYATVEDTQHHHGHENGGADEIAFIGLSGLLADAQTPLAHIASHEHLGTDELSVLGLSGLLADQQTPAAHKTSHQLAGADEISVLGLSGVLADGQTPLAHKTSHQNGGADEISVLDLSGLLADGQTPLAHAVSHMRSGADDALRAIVVFGCAGAPVDTQYVVPGFAAINAAEIGAVIPDAMHLTKVRVACVTAPGAGITDIYTVVINGTASAAAASLVETAVEGAWNGSLAVAANARIAVQATVGIGSASQNITVLCYFEN